METASQTDAMRASFLTADGIRGTACPNCRTRMMLTSIKPSRLGFDLRTFKCDACNHTEKLAVETNAKRQHSIGMTTEALRAFRKR
jgi:predicted Zn finger-like uncharacterized protein